MQDTRYFSLCFYCPPSPQKHKPLYYWGWSGKLASRTKKKSVNFFCCHFRTFLFFILLHFSRHYQSSLKSGEQMHSLFSQYSKKKISDLLDCVWLNLWIWTDDNLSKTQCTKIWEKSNISYRNIYTKEIFVLVRIIYFRTFCPN